MKIKERIFQTIMRRAGDQENGDESKNAGALTGQDATKDAGGKGHEQHAEGGPECGDGGEGEHVGETGKRGGEHVAGVVIGRQRRAGGKNAGAVQGLEVRELREFAGVDEIVGPGGKDVVLEEMRDGDDGLPGPDEGGEAGEESGPDFCRRCGGRFGFGAPGDGEADG